MAGSPRVVTADISFQWDGVPWRLQRGQVIDVPPDSDLERAIGADMLTPLGGVAAQPEPEAAPEAAEDAQDEADDEGEAESQPSAKTRRSAAKADDSGSEDETADAGGGDAM